MLKYNIFKADEALKSYIFLDKTPVVRWKSADSLEYAVSIFRVEAKANKEPACSGQQTELCDMSLRNIGWLSTEYAMFYPRR
jgi:hypothetical protein